MYSLGDYLREKRGDTQVQYALRSDRTVLLTNSLSLAVTIAATTFIRLEVKTNGAL